MYRERPPREKGFNRSYALDGIAELWYDDRESMTRATSSPEGKALLADGALFIGRIKTFTVEERTIIGF